MRMPPYRFMKTVGCGDASIQAHHLSLLLAVVSHPLSPTLSLDTEDRVDRDLWPQSAHLALMKNAAGKAIIM
ncbi:uncharacterized protein K489DRAFT_383068 [Dissoconium aciculare CBS 342.82]|uniref:Uncharacterized protein n=1 Tax=Dissoconium aciculare CBS 342.82 TaxID=1314786 RepID=A0A6J3LWZ5_9PEZI|nr:uncharacterized protein K489DRAFT_383068 [Dissoconium aciculare CBS 342.82]KAF1820276.1 hypothetical protein K489DRAFT_383068 [Dissoconium aciculare CBS 342.82]